MTNKISKQTYVFHEIVQFLADYDQIRMQQLSKKFYNKIVPFCVEPISIKKSSPHVKVQGSVYQYASGFLMHKELKQIVKDAEGPSDAISSWGYKLPVNTAY